LTETRKAAAAGGAGSGPAAKQVAGVTLAARLLDNVPAKELKGMADEIKRQIGSGVVALVAVADGRASLVVGVTEDLTKRLNAVDLVKVGSAALGGQGGGGRPDMAQAGGPDASRAKDALAAIESAIGAGAKAAE
jgi:alanyl-tRNA synthetase